MWMNNVAEKLSGTNIADKLDLFKNAAQRGLSQLANQACLISCLYQNKILYLLLYLNTILYLFILADFER